MRCQFQSRSGVGSAYISLNRSLLTNRSEPYRDISFFSGQCSEAIVSELRRRPERTEAEAPARMDPLFGAVDRPADARPAQIYERGVGRVQRGHPERQIRASVGRAGRRARGREGGGEGVKGRSVVRVHGRVELQIEGVTVRRREGVTVREGVGGRGVEAQTRARGAAGANRFLPARSVRHPGRDETPRVDAGAVRGRTRSRDDVDLQTTGFGAPQTGVRVQGEGHRRLVLGLKRVLTQRQIQH